MHWHRGASGLAVALPQASVPVCVTGQSTVWYGAGPGCGPASISRAWHRYTRQLRSLWLGREAARRMLKGTDLGATHTARGPSFCLPPWDGLNLFVPQISHL